jgi:hypothetical protein
MENTCEVKTKPRNFKEFIKSRGFLRTMLGILIGCIAGYAYYYFIGCSNGSCSITSSPVNSTIFGGLMGLFVTSSPCACK